MMRLIGSAQLVVCASISYLVGSAWVREIQRDIYRRLGHTMDQAQIYKIIRTLKARGLIQRVPDTGAASHGAKVVIYELTASGRAAVAATAAIATAVKESKDG